MNLIGCVLVAVTQAGTPHIVETDYTRVVSKGEKVYIYRCERGYEEARAYFAARKRPSPLERKP